MTPHDHQMNKAFSRIMTRASPVQDSPCNLTWIPLHVEGLLSLLVNEGVGLLRRDMVHSTW